MALLLHILSLSAPFSSLHGSIISLHGSIAILHGSIFSFHGSIVSLHGPIFSLHSSWLFTLVLYHRERILETSTLSCNEEEEEITKPPKR
jgi:hypothetical protein